MPAFAPKKSLGQNFLTDKNLARKIITALNLSESEYVLEIGPGMGALTGIILETGANLTCVEIDSRAIELLKEKFTNNYNNLTIQQISILDFDILAYFGAFTKTKIKIIGNIPYYLSNDILFKIIGCREIVSSMVLTVQKEVAQRWTAKPGNKTYGAPSVAVALAGNAKILFDISAGSFFPKPKVTSSVIKFEFNNERLTSEKLGGIMKIARAAFEQRRKTLGNSLKSYINSKYSTSALEYIIECEKAGIDFSKRAEQLSSKDYEMLYEIGLKIKSCS